MTPGRECTPPLSSYAVDTDSASRRFLTEPADEPFMDVSQEPDERRWRLAISELGNAALEISARYRLFGERPDTRLSVAMAVDKPSSGLCLEVYPRDTLPFPSRLDMKAAILREDSPSPAVQRALTIRYALPLVLWRRRAFLLLVAFFLLCGIWGLPA